MRRTMARVAGVSVVMVLAVGLGACGDDDDTDTSAPDTPAGVQGDPAAFCDGFVEFNSAILEVDLEEDASEADAKEAGAAVGPLMQSLVDNAPAALEGDAETLNDAVQPLNDGDAGPFNADETFETFTRFASASIEECDFEAVEVTAVDYGFEGVPATMASGTLAFEMTNVSDTEDHEMVIFRKADGETRSMEELLELPEDQTEDVVEFRGAAFAPPGESGSALAELDAGNYAMVCFIPVGGTEDGPPHFTQGMFQEFVVES